LLHQGDGIRLGAYAGVPVSGVAVGG